MELFLARDYQKTITAGVYNNLLAVLAQTPLDAAALIRKAKGDALITFGQLTCVGASWNDVSNNLSETAAFTYFDHSVGDTAYFVVTGGTGAVPGIYTVVSRTSANAIVLGQSVSGKTGNLTGVVTGYVFRVMPMWDSDNVLASLTPGNVRGTDFSLEQGVKFHLRILGS